LNSASTDVDRISVFWAVDDLIRLDNDFYTAFLTENVALTSAAFHSGGGVTLAHDATDRIIYNTTTGNLYYDPDGTLLGGIAATHFAACTGAPAITAADFFIVA